MKRPYWLTAIAAAVALWPAAFPEAGKAQGQSAPDPSRFVSCTVASAFPSQSAQGLRDCRALLTRQPLGGRIVTVYYCFMSPEEKDI